MPKPLCQNRATVKRSRAAQHGNNTIDFDFPHALPIGDHTSILLGLPACLLSAITTKTTVHLTNSIIDGVPKHHAFTNHQPEKNHKVGLGFVRNDGVDPQTIPDYSTDLRQIICFVFSLVRFLLLRP